MGKTEVASIFKKGKDAIRKRRKNNGTCKKSKKSKSMGQTEMENEVWQEVFGDWGKIFAEKAIKAMSASEYARTTAAKRKGKAAGKQFVKQPKSIAKKTKQYRRYS